MASLTCKRVSLARPTTVSRTRRTVVSVKALSLNEAGNLIAGAFVKIFSKPETNVDNFATNNFSGKISHHEAGRKPFRDGYSANASVPIAAESSLERVPEVNQEDAAGYVADAVKGVVSGLPSSSSTEPEWTGATNWNGDVHSTDNKRNARDGFHTRKV